MPSQKTLIFIFFGLFIQGTAFPQKVHNGGKSTYTRTRFNYNATRVKGAKAKTVCPIFESSKYPYQGIGFKLGDPFAITYKYYFNKHISIAADLGKASSGLYNRYYRDKFTEYAKSDTLQKGASLSYLTNKVMSDWVGEVKLLYALDAKKIAPGLQVYVGLGLQARSTGLQYDYLYSNSDKSADNEFGRFQKNRITVGQTTVVGIEYSYFHMPISAFMEMALYTDIMLDPGWEKVQGGVGLRYVF